MHFSLLNSTPIHGEDLHSSDTKICFMSGLVRRSGPGKGRHLLEKNNLNCYLIQMESKSKVQNWVVCQTVGMYNIIKAQQLHLAARNFL